MHDIRIGEPEEFRSAFWRSAYTFVHRPHFSSPALWNFPRGMNRDSHGCAALFRCFPRQVSGAVVAVIVHDDHGKLAGIVLFGEGSDRARDSFRFIARGYNRYDAWP